MVRWLRHDLTANNKPWIIAFWHHPPYSKGHHDSDDLKDSGGRMAWMRETIVPILDEAGVDIVFTGHSHSYERSKFISRYYSTASKFTEKYVVEGGTRSGVKEGSYSKRSLSKTPYSGTVYVTSWSARSSRYGGLRGDLRFCVPEDRWK
jgi:3',5'-cyclic AMP phosphodiesterase CpdA